MIRCLAAVMWALLALPAAATQDQWPALFDVAGVTADDVLNIRAAPTVHAEVVSTFAPDATGIEVIRPDDSYTWGLVNTAEGRGWVSLAYLSRRPGQWAGSLIAIRRCLGTEPFWSLSVDDEGHAVWREPDGPSLAGSVIDRLASLNRRDVQSAEVTFADGTQASTVLRLAACSDFMSENEWGIAIDILWQDAAGGRLLSGCCSLAD